MSEPQIVAKEFAVWGGRTIVAVTDPERLPAALASVREVIDAVDRACSSYRTDSELAAVNAAAGQPLRVSPLLVEHVEAALRAAEATDGDLDPTVGEALVALGFSGGAPERPPRVELQAVPGYRTIAVDREAATIRCGRGVRLDLGATAKALAADQAAAAAQAAAGASTGVLVSLMGDLALAGPSPAEGWRIRVTEDHRSGQQAPGQWISIRSGGLATSSTTVRVRDAGTQRLHHVIDPATGAPASVHFRTVSVAAASCLDANVASTAAIVRGEAAAGWLEELSLPSRLVHLDGSVLHVAAWPEEGEELPLRAAAGMGAAL